MAGRRQDALPLAEGAARAVRVALALGLAHAIWTDPVVKAALLDVS